MTESTLLGLTLTYSGLSDHFPLVKVLTKLPPQRCNFLLKRVFISLPAAALSVRKMVIKLILNINDLCSYGQVNSDMQQYTFTAPCSEMSPWWSSSQWKLCPLWTSGSTQNIWHLEAGGLCLLWQFNCCSDYLQLKTFGLLELVKPQSFAERNEFLKTLPENGSPVDLPLFQRHCKGEGEVGGRPVCTQPTWRAETKPELETSEREVSI